MADNNFKVFDETKTNVMSDADYANHTQRSNGVQSGIASSALHNKLYRQVSMMSKALADFIASQAFDAKDEDSQLLSQNLQKALTKFAKTPLDDHNTNPAAHAGGIAGNAATATADQDGVQFTQGYVGGRTYLNAGMFHAWNEIMTAGVYTIDESCFDLQGAPSGMVTSGVLVVFLMQDTVAQLYIANRYNAVTDNTALKSMATRLYINNAWTLWRYAADYSGIARKFLILSGGTLTGDLTVPTVHGNLDGNASSATKLKDGANITVTGLASSSPVKFDGSEDVSFSINNIQQANSLAFSGDAAPHAVDSIAIDAITKNRMLIHKANGINTNNGHVSYGTLFSMPFGRDSTRNMVQQMIFENDNGVIWFRNNNHGNGGFAPWRQVAFIDNITAIESMGQNTRNAWWVKLKGGLMIQGGIYISPGSLSNNTAFQCSFPISFSKQCYSIVGNDIGDGVFTMAFSPISNSQFNAYKANHKSNNIVYFQIIAIGE